VVTTQAYPFYYVTNTGALSTTQNTWGIYGMDEVGSQGLNAFLEGLANQPYVFNDTWITGQPGVVYLSSQVQSLCNYYGLYPSTYQTSTRALPTAITYQYNLAVTTYLFNTTFGGGTYDPGAVYEHVVGTTYQGGFFALGMDRIPDIRLAALGILCDYQPTRYGSLYTAAGSNRLVVLQLGTVGSG